MLSFPRVALRFALVACVLIALAGVIAGTVRLLPWLLDPAVPWTVAGPFARGLAAVAIETAVLVGWPVGWALAAWQCVETGEARVLATLGERPELTVTRLFPHGALFALFLAGASLLYANDARAPGRVATELVTQGRASCAAARSPRTYSIPFTDMTWLCAPGRAPRLAGAGPGAMSGALLTASGARIAGDFTALELDDARVLLPSQPPIAVHAASLELHGMAPWARASVLPAWLRAALLVCAGWAAAAIAAYGVLSGAVKGRIVAGGIAALGPLAGLGVLRLLERMAGVRPGMFALVPLAVALCCGAAASLTLVLSRLRHKGATASTRGASV